MLDNIKMNVIQTAENGIVNHETIFYFEQNGKKVSASYSGGKIEQGYLIGTLNDSQLAFTYCQLRTTGEMDHGQSNCALVIDEVSGKLTLEEHFKMSTNGSREDGLNIFMEI